MEFGVIIDTTFASVIVSDMVSHLFCQGYYYLSTWSWVTSSNILCITYTCINTFSHMRHLHAYFTSGPFCGYTPPSGPSEGIIVLAKMPKKVTSGHLLWVFSHPLQGLRRAFSCLYKATTDSLWMEHNVPYLTRSDDPDRGNQLWAFQFMQVITTAGTPTKY